MTMTSQTKAYLEYIATNNVLPENPTLEDLRADAADYLKYAGPLSDDVHTEHTYFTSPTADLHAVIYRPKNVKPNAPALVYFHGGGVSLTESNFLAKSSSFFFPLWSVATALSSYISVLA